MNFKIEEFKSCEKTGLIAKIFFSLKNKSNKTLHKINSKLHIQHSSFDISEYCQMRYYGH